MNHSKPKRAPKYHGIDYGKLFTVRLLNFIVVPFLFLPYASNCDDKSCHTRPACSKATLVPMTRVRNVIKGGYDGYEFQKIQLVLSEWRMEWRMSGLFDFSPEQSKL